jgi:DNA mismatch endonuclease (patch repair protein)
MMAGIRSKNTKPELIVRKALHARGFRFRLHDKNLLGKPDIVLHKYNAVIFVNGCFWHGHDCHLFKWPKTRAEFWRAKIEGNQKRDARNIVLLRDMNWRVLVIWECSIMGATRLSTGGLTNILSNWLISGQSSREVVGSRT